MEIKMLQERIEKKQLQIAKIEKRIAKWENTKTDKAFMKAYDWCERETGWWNRQTGKYDLSYEAFKELHWNEHIEDCDKEIRYRLNRLSNKRNGYFLDREMWESICRVERGKVSNKMRFSIYKRDGYRCKMCGRSDRFAYLEIDHIKPIAKGGKSIYSNLQTLCSKCNAKKGDSY